MIHAQVRPAETEASRVAGTAVDRIAAAVEVLHEDDAEVADLDTVALCAVDAIDALGAIRTGAEPTHAAIGRCVRSIGDLIELLELNPSRSAKVLGAIAIVARAFRMLCQLGATMEPPAPARETGPVAAELRQERRVPLQVTVGLQGENNFFTGYTEDISDGGVFVATYEPLPIGTPVGIELVLPHGRRVCASGDVVWIRAPWDVSGELSPGMGIGLRGMAEADRRAILAFLAERTPFFHDS